MLKQVSLNCDKQLERRIQGGPKNNLGLLETGHSYWTEGGANTNMLLYVIGGLNGEGAIGRMGNCIFKIIGCIQNSLE